VRQSFNTASKCRDVIPHPCDKMNAVLEKKFKEKTEYSNTLSNKTKKSNSVIRNFIEEQNGMPERTFCRILIVNNGLSALRLIQGIKSLSYMISGGTDSNLIQIVALASDADWIGDSNEDALGRPEYLKQFGIEIARLDGTRPTDTYQNQDKVLRIAKEYRCDSVAVGWGHLAENVEFAKRVHDRGLVFIGPPVNAMRAMGDKIMSKLIMQAAGVPMLRWSGSYEVIHDNKNKIAEIEKLLFTKDGGKILEMKGDLYRIAYDNFGVHTFDRAADITRKIGLPVAIKATAGGGGRGIRFVNNMGELESGFNAARAESRAAFGNEVVFMEKAAIGGIRHVEEQILADCHGNVVALGERECSIQRHNQKLIEEAGVGIPISEETRQRIRKASVSAAISVGYQGAGTVEFLVDDAGNPYFMEMNTRLQVEHIATEALIPGLDLVIEQLKVAMGIPLSPELRNRGLDFSSSGHSISVRLLAENPDAGFSPQSGTVKDIEIPPTDPNTPRYYFSHGPSSMVHSFADSQIGHVVSKGKSREEARLHMIAFLDRLRYRGILTSTGFAMDLLRDPEYIDGKNIHTGWIPEIIKKRDSAVGSVTERPDLALMAMALIDLNVRKADLRMQFLSCIKTGQTIRPTLMANTSITRVRYRGNIYDIYVREAGVDLYNVTLCGMTASVRFWENSPFGSYLFEASGEILRVYRTDEVVESHIEIGGRTTTFTTDLDPTTFRAPLSGTVTEILVEAGSRVEEGETLLSLEAMKMITSLESPLQGMVSEILVKTGDSVEAGAILVRFEGETDNEICREETKVVPDKRIEDLWYSLVGENKEITLARFHSISSPKALDSLRRPLEFILSGYSYPAVIVELLLEESLRLRGIVNESEWISFLSILVERFYRDERYFSGGMNVAAALEAIDIINDPVDFHTLARAHAQLDVKRYVLSRLLDGLSVMDYRSIADDLKAVVSLGYNDQYREIVAKAEELLYLLSLKSGSSQDLDEMMEQILEAEESGDKEARERIIGALMEASESFMGRLIGYLLTGRTGLRRLAGKLIILRAYRRHPDLSCVYEKSPEGKRTYIWRFRDERSNHFRIGLVSLVLPGETVEELLLRLYSKLESMWLSEPDSPHSDDVIELLISRPSEAANSDQLSALLRDTINNSLGHAKLKRITFVVRDSKENYPGLYTCRPLGKDGEYVEDRLYRDLHPSLGHVLNIRQLEPFANYMAKLPSSDMNVHLYHYLKHNPRGRDYPEIENRIYVRTMIRNSRIVMEEDGPTFPAAKEAFRASLRHLRISYAATGARTHNNQIYLRFVRPIRLSWTETRRILVKMQHHLRDYADVDLTRTEIHGWAYSSYRPEKSVEILIVVDNPTGQMLQFKPYVIMEHTFPGESEPTRAIIPNEEFEHSLKDADYSPPEEAWQKLHELYRDLDRLDRKRQARRSKGKVYVYDRPALIEGELEKIWGESGKAIPDNLFSAHELILDRSGHLVPIERAPERNILSIVVWKVRIKTPEAPEGRDIVIVSGDMTIRGGSVAIREDMTYAAASELASAEGIPFVYFAEGSGARIGLDRLVSHSLNYDDESDELYLTASDYKLLKPLVAARPRTAGLAGSEGSYVVTSIIGGVPGIRADIDEGYLYLTEPDYRVHSDNVEAHERKVIVNGAEQQRWVISSIIKSSPELNQENLSGSARMARASSMAFHSVPTMAIVTDTCTGIISYNVRLLKRVIQTKQSEIILTGYRALNALYGGDKIFSSNRELGGPDIMGPNGVSHRIAEDERDACKLLLGWIRGLPPAIGKKTPLIPFDDSISRDVEEDLIGDKGLISPLAIDAERPKPYDGLKLAEILFDMGSTQEEMGAWGGGVRVGRASMGGIPIGFIAVETGTTVKHIPADPADPDTVAVDKMEFGQVWYPDSSFKTAQWIEFMRRERRPLVIMPNWRGFAGGKRELFEEILKYGAMIVDELSKYDLPVVLYMPPYAEIRGGAWVVVDSQINPEHIKFLVDEHATGSVLEPSGMESVPLVEREIRKDMRDNDPVLAKLYDERKRYPGQLDRVRDIDEKLDEREKELYPSYVKKWIRIFRKHNTAERMKIVGTAHELVPTGKARERIYSALVEGLEKIDWE